ncbi:MAG TPA: hypothetical protein VMU01_00780 [Rhizomicrobium sp.]|nr:hypothetical protein [Rhizomicrobium sp.]
MTDNSNRIAKLMAATSVLGLALGMTAQAADSNQIKNGDTQTTTQIKGETNQGKFWTGQIKHNTGTNQLKYESNQGKFSTEFLKHNTGTNQLKYESNQLKGSSTQIKLDGVSGQHKHDVPSTELNPQPEPPAPTAGNPTPK